MEIGWYVKHEMFPESMFKITDVRGPVIECTTVIGDEGQVTFSQLHLITRCNADGTPYVEPVIEAPVRAFKFLKGDKVRCLNNAAGQFTRGKIYTVSHDGDTVSVDEDDGGIRNGWLGEFFELAEEVNRHITLHKYIIIFFNHRTQKVSCETRDTEHQAQELIDRLGRDGHPVLKKTKLKFDVEVPEGVI